MASSRNLYLAVWITVSIPGLLLGYLSYRTIQNEKNLIEQAEQRRREEFLARFEQVLMQSEKRAMKEIQESLIRSSSAPADPMFYLATDLLSLPAIGAVIGMEGNHRVLPPTGSSHRPAEASPADFAEVDHNEEWQREIQQAYKKKNYRECIRKIESREGLGPNRRAHLGSDIFWGFQLLKLKCYRMAGREREAMAFGERLVEDLLGTQPVISLATREFYLAEALTVLTSLESISRSQRDHYWSLSQRITPYFQNARVVRETWNHDISFWTQMGGRSLAEGIELVHSDGTPILRIGFPWVDSRYLLFAQIKLEPFLKEARLALRLSADDRWKGIEYSVRNRNDLLLEAPGHFDLDQPVLERILNTDLLHWKISVFSGTRDERSKLASQKVLILYLMLGFAILILFAGGIFTLRGVLEERKAVRLKTNFLSAVTHELKTPLTSIRIFAELMESGRQSDNLRIKKYASMIGKEANRLQTMVDNILNTAKFESPGFKFSMENIDLSCVAKELSELLQGAFDEAGIALELRLGEGCTVRGSREALRSIFQNLLDNALKYSPKGSRVTLAVQREGSRVLLSVTDEGPGIADEALRHIFDRFYRAKDEMTRDTKGTGLGLSLVRQIVLQHGGTIWVDSKSGQGATFTVRFHAADSPALPNPKKQTETTVQSLNSGGTYG